VGKLTIKNSIINKLCALTKIHMKIKLVLVFFLASISSIAIAQKNKSYQLRSPDGKVSVDISTGPSLTWSVNHKNTSVITPSAIALTLAGGEVLGNNLNVSSAKTTTVNTSFASPFYKKSSVIDNYNQLTVNGKNGYGITFRAYNDGAAYRFFTSRKGNLTITSEQVDFIFNKDYQGFFPFVRDFRVAGDPYQTSFESTYDEIKLSQFAKDTLAFLPVLVALDNGKKAVIVEADLEDYPGMYVTVHNPLAKTLQGAYAPYPAKETMRGRNLVVTEREQFIAKTQGSRSFP
jgi:alpha-glucosidase